MLRYDLPIGPLISKAGQRMRQELSRWLEPHELTPHELFMMVVLLDRPVVSARDLASQVGIYEATASRMVSSLVARGWVAPTRDPDDARRTVLKLTASGRRQATKLQALAVRFAAQMAKGIGESERRAACATLERIIANMDELRAPSKAASRPRRRRRPEAVDA